MDKSSDINKPPRTRTRRRRISLGLTQHLDNGTRVAARKAICGILWLGVMFLFTGIILLVTSKHKGILFKSWGGVITGIGICLVFICLILCIHAYWATTDAKRLEAEWDEKHPGQLRYGLPAQFQKQVDQKSYIIEIDATTSKTYPPDKECDVIDTTSSQVVTSSDDKHWPNRYRLFDRTSDGVYYYPTTVQPIVEEEDDDVTSVHSRSSSGENPKNKQWNNNNNTCLIAKTDTSTSEKNSSTVESNHGKTSKIDDVMLAISPKLGDVVLGISSNTSRVLPPSYTETMERFPVKTNKCLEH